MRLTERVSSWREDGRRETFLDLSIHVHQRDREGVPLVLLHGFPSSSYDWRPLLAEETNHPVLTFDFLGFGLSEKPRDHVYTLAWQADLVEEMVKRHLGGRPAFIVAHDMGTSVATELLARDLAGNLDVELAGVLLFNGSIVLERASLTRSQRLLRGPLGQVAARLANEPVFRREFGALFSAEHPLSREEASDQWSLICYEGGRTLGARLIHYLDERRRYAARWHGAVRDWPGALSFAWGTGDPVATTSVLDALVELRPAAPVERLDGLGHYPQIESPAAIAGVIRRAVGRRAVALSPAR